MDETPSFSEFVQQTIARFQSDPNVRPEVLDVIEQAYQPGGSLYQMAVTADGASASVAGETAVLYTGYDTVSGVHTGQLAAAYASNPANNAYTVSDTEAGKYRAQRLGRAADGGFDPTMRGKQGHSGFCAPSGGVL